jgi:Zn-finger nucleic acid-binding protein
MEHDPDSHNLQCPKCQHGMDEVTHEGITIDRCSNCQGLWFDDDEAHQLKLKGGGSGVVDVGDSKKGWLWDSHSDINCPHCNKEMKKAADPDQKHIWYELCEEHGMFMDAGEFSDFEDESLLDRFRALIKGDRETTAP